MGSAVRFSLIQVMALLLLAPLPGAAEDVLQVCVGKYALCAAAPCKPIPQKVDGQSTTPTEALCECVVANGSNIGTGACEDRATGDGRQYLISTYSFGLVATHPTMTCTRGAYTNCFGSPCLVDPLDTTRAVCTCSIVPNQEGKPFVTQGGQCQTDTCPTALWSSASLAENLYVNQLLAASLGLEQAPENRCPEYP